MANTAVTYLSIDSPIIKTEDDININHQIFDVINSTMTRQRWLNKIADTYKKFEDIVNQLKKWYKVVGIWCWKKQTEEDILKLHPEIEIYGIDLKDFNPESKIKVLEQNLLKWIQLPEKTAFVYSFYTLQYLPNPLRIIKEIYKQLPSGGIAVLHMWPIGIFDANIGKYINEQIDNNDKIRRERTTEKDVSWDWLPGDYLIIRKSKNKEEKINLPITKARKIEKIGVIDRDSKVHINNNGELMFSIEIDEIETEAKNKIWRIKTISTPPKNPQLPS